MTLKDLGILKITLPFIVINISIAIRGEIMSSSLPLIPLFELSEVSSAARCVVVPAALPHVLHLCVIHQQGFTVWLCGLWNVKYSPGCHFELSEARSTAEHFNSQGHRALLSSLRHFSEASRIFILLFVTKRVTLDTSLILFPRSPAAEKTFCPQ